MTKLAALNIREGTKKEKVAIVFLKDGKEAAVKKAKQLGLQETTAKTWASGWGNGNGAAKKTARKAPAKKTAKKATTAKAPAKKAAKREQLAA